VGFDGLLAMSTQPVAPQGSGRRNERRADRRDQRQGGRRSDSRRRRGRDSSDDETETDTEDDETDTDDDEEDEDNGGEEEDDEEEEEEDDPRRRRGRRKGRRREGQQHEGQGGHPDEGAAPQRDAYGNILASSGAAGYYGGYDPQYGERHYAQQGAEEDDEAMQMLTARDTPLKSLSWSDEHGLPLVLVHYSDRLHYSNSHMGVFDGDHDSSHCCVIC
jgi:cobalamin biosynthesis protein CobT